MRMPQHLTPVVKLPQRGQPANDADSDEISAGNAGFETQPLPHQYTQTEAEKREYMYGHRAGMAKGLVGGVLLGALAALGIVSFGVYTAVGVWP